MENERSECSDKEFLKRAEHHPFFRVSGNEQQQPTGETNMTKEQPSEEQLSEEQIEAVNEAVQAALANLGPFLNTVRAAVQQIQYAFQDPELRKVLTLANMASAKDLKLTLEMKDILENWDGSKFPGIKVEDLCFPRVDKPKEEDGQ